jgi:predicted permease
MALRMALGSGRARLAAMLITETLLLATIAGFLASVVVYQAPALLLTWITQHTPTYSTAPDWRVFVFLVVTTMFATVVAANAPLRATFGLDLVAALRGLSSDANRARSRTPSRLMGVQVGGATALLVAALAMTRLPARVADAPPHIDASRVLNLNLHSPTPASDERRAFHDELGSVIAAAPAVQRVAFGSAMPIGDEEAGTVDATVGARPRRVLPSIFVSPEYLDVFGIRLLRGRDFNAGDTDCSAAICPAIVSRETARELWPNRDPIGETLAIASGASLQVVGVVTDASSDVAEPAQALMVYRPWTPTTQMYHPFVRFDGDADAASRAIQTAIVRRFPGSASAPETVQRTLERVTDAFARIGVLVAAVAAISALLAIIGVYGVISLAARRRTKEMGIRIALGARHADIYRAMLGGSVQPVFVGLMCGAMGATVLTFVVDRMLSAVFPIRIADPVASVSATALLAIVAVVAMLLPARRAMQVDPVTALRTD